MLTSIAMIMYMAWASQTTKMRHIILIYLLVYILIILFNRNVAFWYTDTHRHTCETGVLILFGKQNPTSGGGLFDAEEAVVKEEICAVVVELLLLLSSKLAQFPFVISFASQSVGLWSKWLSSSLRKCPFLLRPTAGLPDKLRLPTTGLRNIFMSIFLTR